MVNRPKNNTQLKSYMSKQMMQLEGQQVVVLGGSSGIGLATASLAKQAGAQAAFGKKRDAVVADIASKLPTERIGVAQEIAQAALFLMTNEFMTGEVLHIDGGGHLI